MPREGRGKGKDEQGSSMESINLLAVRSCEGEVQVLDGLALLVGLRLREPDVGHAACANGLDALEGHQLFVAGDPVSESFGRGRGVGIYIFVLDRGECFEVELDRLLEVRNAHAHVVDHFRCSCCLEGLSERLWILILS